MKSREYVKLSYTFAIIIFFIFTLGLEFQSYQAFYSGEHNIDLGYNTKNTTFMYDVMNTGEIVETSYLYRLGGNQIRDSLKISLVSKLIIFLLGILIGIRTIS